MSTIYSGLGWSCDSDFYAYAADTLIGTNRFGDDAYKTYDGGAIVASINVSGAGDFWAIISTVENYTAIYQASYGEPVRSFLIDGVRWYIVASVYGYDGQPSSYPYANPNDAIENPSTDADYENIVELMLTAANMQSTVTNIPTVNYVKEFVEGVETETATRVNALNTAKQPKTMSSAVSVGGVSQSTVENAISAIASKISKIDFDIHRNLGTEITAAQKLAIANGTFEDLPIGAYWVLNGTIYRIAHHDYYLGTGDGDTECTSHHIVVVPDNTMYNAQMNSTDTTAGGYANSKMRTTNLATALSTFETDFGAAHILSHRIIITNAVTNGNASGWAWYDSKVDLMSENMLYGHSVWGSTDYETGLERGQLSLFSLRPEFIQKQRAWFWTRTISSNNAVCTVSSTGYAANYDRASHFGGVRPYVCIYFDDVL